MDLCSLAMAELEMTSRSSAEKGDVLILLGTRKGAFILNSDQTRKNWTMAGPYCAGSEVFHMVYDQREGGRVFAASNSMIWGPEFQFSDNLGQSWASAETQPKFSGDGGPTVKNLWHVELGRDTEPGVLYVGVEPAALFKSEDGGKNWFEVSGLSNHPTQGQWQPGLGGLCLHSIVLDPNKLERGLGRHIGRWSVPDHRRWGKLAYQESRGQGRLFA